MFMLYYFLLYNKHVDKEQKSLVIMNNSAPTSWTKLQTHHGFWNLCLRMLENYI
jgi:hypothetical protein